MNVSHRRMVMIHWFVQLNFDICFKLFILHPFLIKGLYGIYNLNKNSLKKNILLLSVYFLTSTILFAGGFQVNLQGQKQAGMGHTGTGLVLDNATVFFNPGGVPFLDSLRGISFGMNFIFPRT